MERDRTFVANKYGNIWGGVRDFVQSARGAGETSFEVLFRRALEFTNDVSPGAVRSPSLPTMFHGVQVVMDKMATEYAWRDVIANEVLYAMPAGTDVIIELGSGWSANIFNLWLRGSPRDARYFGAELIEAGRQAAVALAATRAEMSFAAPSFDWSSPDFSFIPIDARSVTVYSCHSIEQVPELSLAPFRDLLRRTSSAANVQGVFIEPVGWQFPEYSDPAIAEQARTYSQEKNYNRNFRATVESLMSEGLIEVTSAAFNVFGYVGNPSSVFHWRRR